MSKLNEAIKDLDKEWEQLQQTVQSLNGDEINSTLNKIDNFQANFENEIGKIGDKLREKISPAKRTSLTGVSLETNLNNINQSISDINTLIENVGQPNNGDNSPLKLLLTTSRSLKDKIISSDENFKDLKQDILDLIEASGQTLEAEFNENLDKICSSFDDGFDQMQESFTQLQNKAEETLSEGFETIGEVIVDLLDDAINQIIDEIIDAATTIIETSLELAAICQSLSALVSPYLPQLVAIRELAKAIREFLEMARAGL